ncbi:alpha/beta hydrolase [Herbidospora sp. NBRC 101105]|uniref:alpha/beta fold hydrolase n=1 Tax=Herbidospora sp. NBRC 101105 TaxID=3032195 RepID=UPI0024A33F04|nr:alpha/beta hydrolase [Herbidospora sp. NBRC 101105]GLX93392.1 non-heme chloroperoxidase [Herbidospora sp. NBRC 101105]
MPYITTNDGVRIFYKDWGTGQPVVFSHGWPLTADVWDNQLRLVAEHGFRGLAHDRRGGGRSDQPWNGNDMDTYADDLAALLDTLDLRDVVLVGHSTGGGEVTRYIGRHGTSRVDKVVLASAVPPHMAASMPIEVFDEIREGVAGDRSQYYRELALPFYGFNRPDAQVSQGAIDAFWMWSMQVGVKSAFECVRAFSETDFTEDLPRIDVPTLVAHGDDDQIVPFEASAPKTARLIPDATLQVYPGAPHGIRGDYEQAFNADLLTFIAK